MILVIPLLTYGLAMIDEEKLVTKQINIFLNIFYTLISFLTTLSLNNLSNPKTITPFDKLILLTLFLHLQHHRVITPFTVQAFEFLSQYFRENHYGSLAPKPLLKFCQ